MIETVMIFALGFLVASLAALLMLPVLNRRSARLARRRIEGLFPTSMQAIAAERDALRAEAAIAQRRLERKVEAAHEHALADRQAAGARVLEIAALERVVEGRDAALAARRTEIDDALARIAGLDRDLATARSEGVAGLAALTALEDAHREILIDLKAARRERDDALLRAETPEETANGPSPDETAVPAATAGLTDPGARHAALAAERDGLRASLSAAEDALARALADSGPRQAREDAELRSRISEVAEALTCRDRLPSVGAFPLPVVARS